MNTYAHPEWLALLAGIIAHPDEDLRRLVAADWLIEHGEEARAEFIQVQCQLGRCQGIHATLTIRMARLYATGEAKAAPLVDRAANLLSEYATAWCQEIGTDAAAAWEWGWHRGFVSVVRSPFVWLMGGRCPVCGHRGRHDVGSDPATEDECTTCHGSGRLTGRLTELVTLHPITRVAVRGLVPFEADGGFRWYFNGPVGGEEGLFPLDVWHHLEAWPGAVFSAVYPTSDLALDAAGLAALMAARGRAGLPPLQPPVPA
jgi:uncharacterized protein (TIGR02996 family)